MNSVAASARATIGVVCLVAMAAMVSGCGQKGPLKLPSKPAAVVSPAASAASSAAIR